MADKLPTVWKIEPHTQAKHAILEHYLNAWYPILSRQAARFRRQFGATKQISEVLFIDGFAGPGKYQGEEPGSPVIALKAAINHDVLFPVPIRMLFVEKDKDRFENLQRVLLPILSEAKSNQNLHVVEPVHGDCDTVLSAMLDKYEHQDIRFGSALAFLDQFGYGDVSMDLISRILAYPQCEVFSYLDYNGMNRWITDTNKQPTFDRLYGGSEWKECVDLPEKQRRSKLLELYKQALRSRGGAKYVTSFIMYDKDERPLYWLLFCTNSLRGLEEMKRAMWTVDRNGSFRFSDHDAPDQLALLDVSFSQKWLAGEIAQRLAGRTMSVLDIKEFVLVETPCYLFKTALKSLERVKRAVVVQEPKGRKPGTYSDDSMPIRFEHSLF